jgi:hypothetical protein
MMQDSNNSSFLVCSKQSYQSKPHGFQTTVPNYTMVPHSFDVPMSPNQKRSPNTLRFPVAGCAPGLPMSAGSTINGSLGHSLFHVGFMGIQGGVMGI